MNFNSVSYDYHLLISDIDYLFAYTEIYFK